jgi:DNA-directed RNA polymerase subunit F
MSTINKKEITVAEAKKFLEETNEDLDPLQRRVLDYSIRFSYVNPENAEKFINDLMDKAGVERNVAVQIANSMPSSMLELRTFLGRQRIISEDSIKNILNVIEKYRST